MSASERMEASVSAASEGQPEAFGLIFRTYPRSACAHSLLIHMVFWDSRPGLKTTVCRRQKTQKD